MNRDVDLDEEEESSRSRSSAHGRRSGSGGRGDHGGNNGAGGGNRKLAIIGGTVGVVVLALIAYFVTRPSGNPANGAVADPTSASQNKTNQTTPSAGPMASANATSGAAANASSSPSSAASGPAATGAASVDIARVHAAVFNASGVSQRALMIKNAMVKDGFALATVGGNMTKTAVTKVYYPSTRADSAAAVAKALAIPTANLTQSNTYTEVTVVIGTDWTTGDTYPAG
ncbi:LytR C-terminal domain-containing protein [Actinocrinis sp.]|uniref:LytR C-terminal domain-containing protein n=1 Tax=Actinocrinis sp. TaxID=1920516 RepID=UPI002C20842F|nr:LytR C-terminal domain-containing protein [Actinocrinis sp.]HXR71292.1 LytR C-terminal domain-containing protein [Actinocrinis sp.]